MPKVNREKLLAALVNCNTKAEAARIAGVTTKTIYAYLRDPAFKKEYEEAKRHLILDASDQIQRSLAPSITALNEIATDPEAGKTARVQAARSILEYGIRLAEYTDHEARIKALEAAREGGPSYEVQKPI